MAKVRVNHDGWLALPAAIRKRLGLSTGDELELELSDGDIVLRPVRSRSVAGEAAPVPATMAEPSVPSTPSAAAATAPMVKRGPGRPRETPRSPAADARRGGRREAAASPGPRGPLPRARRLHRGAVDSPPGMAAVIRVVRNRMADPRFPDDACAAVAQVPSSSRWRGPPAPEVVRDPEGHDIAQVVGARSPHARGCSWRRCGWRASRSARPTRREVPSTSSTPTLMDAGRCPWFAALRRTARIGGHVFLAEHRPPPCRPAARTGRPVVAATDGP